MLFLNSNFLGSTIREDKGVHGAIFVDSILIRESELDYANGKQAIPFESIADKEFLNSLTGLLVFNEHPKDMVSAENFNALSRKSIGTIVNAEVRNMNGDNVVYGTLRIADTSLIKDIKERRITGGSMGYYADNINMNGKNTQLHLKPNHFCLTNNPRDRGVKIFNSNKGENMEKQEFVSAMQEVLNSQNKDSIVISKPVFNSLMQTIGSKIVDDSVSKALASKDGLDKIHYLDSALSIKNIFKNEDDEKAKAEEAEKTNSELEESKKENSELKEKLNSITAELEALKAKTNSDDSGDKGDDKQNSDGSDDDEKQNACDSDEKKNSVVLNTQVPITNSASAPENEFAKFASVVNQNPIFA